MTKTMIKKSLRAYISGGLLENLVLPHSNMIRLFLLQSFKEQVQRGTVIAVILLGAAVLDHGQKHFQRLFLGRSLMEQIEHEGAVQGNLGFLPKRVVAGCVLRGSVFDEIVNEPEYIGVLSDVAEGIVAVGAGGVNQVECPQDIAPLEEQRADGPEDLLR